MSRIFVTGGSGRLGRSVVAGLAEAGHNVISVDRDAIPADQLPAGVVQETGDLLAPGEAMRLLRETSPDAVIHLGGVPTEDTWDTLLRVNVDGARTVLESACAAKVVMTRCVSTGTATSWISSSRTM